MLQDKPQEVFAFEGAVKGFSGTAFDVLKGDMAISIGHDIFWQGDETILLPLAAADMNHFALTVDVAHLQGQGLRKAQAHGIGCQQKNPVAQFAGRSDQLFNFADGEDIGQ